jgi:hypothetical protein
MKVNFVTGKKIRGDIESRAQKRGDRAEVEKETGGEREDAKKGKFGGEEWGGSRGTDTDKRRDRGS